jgi:hypothetical protein
LQVENPRLFLKKHSKRGIKGNMEQKKKMKQRKKAEEMDKE